MKRISLKDMTEEQKKARKRKQKAEAQKRYYQKHKDYYKNYSKIWAKELLENKDKEIERLRLIIKAIKEQCDVTESYEMNEFIRQLENEPADSKWLKRVAGDNNE